MGQIPGKGKATQDEKGTAENRKKQQIQAKILEKLNDPTLTRLDLRNQNISVLPVPITQLQSLTWLNLPNNQISTLPDYFYELTNLVTLRLLGNHITTMAPGLSRLVNLTSLDLSKNKLVNVPDCFGELVALRELNFHWNKVEEVTTTLGNLKNVKSLNVSLNRLLDFPDYISPSLESLDLAHNRLSTLPVACKNLSNVHTLNLAGNCLEELDDKNIVGLKSLRTLDVQCNDLKALPTTLDNLAPTLKFLRLKSNQLKSLPDSICTLYTMEELEASQNLIVDLPKQGMAKLTKLQSLFLYNNQIKELPDDMTGMVNLREIGAAFNELTSLPLNLGNIPKLVNLFLNHNHLTTFDAKIAAGLTGLHELTLNNNEIRVMPDTTSCMVQLRKLDCSVNKLKTFPSITTCTHLSWLELGANRFKEVPKSIYTHTNLTVLNLFGNYLTELPPEIGQLVNLKKFHISYNRMTDLPDEMEKMTSLSELFASGNMFLHIPACILKLCSLSELSLSNNQIHDIPSQISNLTNLKVLQMNANKLIKLPPAIGNLTSLNEIDLSHNELHELPSEFGNLVDMLDLDVSGNALYCIPETFLVSCVGIRQLKIGYNRLRRIPHFQVSETESRPWMNIAGNEWLSDWYSGKVNELKLQARLEKQEKKLQKAQKDKQKRKLDGSIVSDSDDDIQGLINDGEGNQGEGDDGTAKKPQNTAHPFQDSEQTSGKDCSDDADDTPNGEQNSGDMPSSSPGKSPVVIQLNSPAKSPEGKNRRGQVTKSPITTKTTSAPWKEKKSTLSEISFEEIMQYRLKLGWAEMRGRRPDMQDTISVFLNFRGNPHRSLLCCFDGHSGERSSELAARRAYQVVTSRLDQIEQKKLLFADIERGNSERYSPVVASPPITIKNDKNVKDLAPPPKQSTSLDQPKTDKGQLPSRSAPTQSDAKEGSDSELTAQSVGKTTRRAVDDRQPEKPKKKKKDSKAERLSEREYIHALTMSFKDLHDDITVKKFEDGTAALIVVVEHDQDRLIVANSGDQRVVLARGHSAIALTTDHKPDEPNEKLRIYDVGGFVNEQKRVDGILALSRALGDNDLQPHVTYEPEVMFVDLKPEDRFLIVACDGLWDVVSNAKAVEITNKYKNPVQAAAALRDIAHALGSGDNISVVVYRLDNYVNWSHINLRTKNKGPPNRRITSSDSSSEGGGQGSSGDKGDGNGQRGRPGRTNTKKKRPVQNLSSTTTGPTTTTTITTANTTTTTTTITTTAATPPTAAASPKHGRDRLNAEPVTSRSPSPSPRAPKQDSDDATSEEEDGKKKRRSGDYADGKKPKAKKSSKPLLNATTSDS